LNTIRELAALTYSLGDLEHCLSQLEGVDDLSPDEHARTEAMKEDLKASIAKINQIIAERKAAQNILTRRERV
jgi:hypothetical protein